MLSLSQSSKELKTDAPTLEKNSKNGSESKPSTSIGENYLIFCPIKSDWIDFVWLQSLQVAIFDGWETLPQRKLYTVKADFTKDLGLNG